MDSEEIVGLLEACFYGRFDALAKQVKSAKGQSLQEKLRILTAVERTPDLPVDLFGVVAAAKKALVSDNAYEAFRIRALRAQGLI